jgi:large subunit ribosomal protein L18
MIKPKDRFARRRRRTRFWLKRLGGGRVRLSVHRSHVHIYAQLIDDEAGRTIAAASTLDPALRGELKGTGNREAARRVGLLVAERGKAAGVGPVVFDRGGYKYHGRVAALAEGAREGGLQL